MRSTVRIPLAGILLLFLTSCTSPSTTSNPSNPATSVDNFESNSANRTFTVQVWADNWFSFFVNGELIKEDSVSISTERSFNSEVFTFTATYPFTVAMVTKDFKENDSGLEYIGSDRQQMGDGGFIAQVTDNETGRVVATTNESWRGLVIHKAPLNMECEKSQNSSTDCEFTSQDEPSGWTEPSFDDSTWTLAQAYTEDEIGAKDGYYDNPWTPEAKLIWTSSLKQDNTILWRYSVTN